MRILHIDTGATLRGGQHQVLLLLNLLRTAGHECTLLARENSPLWASGIGAGFPVYSATGLQVLKHSRRADLVHAHDAEAHTLASFWSSRIFVVSRRVAFRVGRGVFSRRKYARAERYLAVSQFVASELRDSGIPEGRIDIIYDAVDTTIKEAEPWNPVYPAVALASRDPEKGRDLVESAALASGVEVIYSDDLKHDLRKASLFVYATRSEGLGSAALLAMQMGVPVIASKIGGLAEVFESNVSGIYVENDPDDIVRAMRRVLASRTLAESLIENARKRISEAFTPYHLVAKTLASYKKAIEG